VRGIMSEKNKMLIVRSLQEYHGQTN
jgi:hypothetical protein